MIVGTDHNEANNPEMLITTETQTSVTPSDEGFTYLNGQISRGIFSDSLDNPIVSEYAKIRLTSSVYYRVFSLVVKFYYTSRNLFK